MDENMFNGFWTGMVIIGIILFVLGIGLGLLIDWLFSHLQVILEWR